MAIYMLVHGATAGGWIWQSVPRLLRASGHDVYTPTLTGLGERRHLFHPDITLDTHVLDVENVLLFEDLHQVILVGHSYGGAVITGVAERSADRLSHLVYLDAFVPEDGKAIKDLYDPPVAEMLAENYRNGRAGLPVNGGEASDPRFTEHPLQTFLQPFHLKSRTASALPEPIFTAPTKRKWASAAKASSGPLEKQKRRDGPITSCPRAITPCGPCRPN